MAIVTIRRPGGSWRLLVHDWIGKQPNGIRYASSHTVTSDPNPPADRQCEYDGLPYAVTHVSYPDAEFDELVVGHWLHVEAMDATTWWMNIAGVTIWVRADRDGRPKKVTVFAPSDYDEPVDGCTYEGAVAP